MQPFNYNYNPMMMGQMNFCVNSANPTIKMEKEKIPKKNLIINFIFDCYKIEVQGNSDMTLKKLIERFRVKLCNDNFSLDYFFKRRKLDKDSEETLAQSGISNCDEILVFEQNDKNQEEKLSKMLSHKHDNITITFNASTGNKTQITVGYILKLVKFLIYIMKNFYLEKLKLEKILGFYIMAQKFKLMIIEQYLNCLEIMILLKLQHMT
jgi:hypothetical protein